MEIEYKQKSETENDRSFFNSFSIKQSLEDFVQDSGSEPFFAQCRAEHVSGAERREFPLLAYMGVRCFAPSLRFIPDSSTRRPLSTHLKFHSAPVKSLHARSNLKEGAIPDVFHRISLGHTARCGLN